MTRKKGNAARAPERELLTDVEMNQIAWAIRDGNADPVDARRLMEDFVSRYGASDWHLSIRYVRDALAAFLNGERASLGAAFGLARGQAGNPGKEASALLKRAVAVLEACLTGQTLADAEHDVAQKIGLSVGRIHDAWRSQKGLALHAVLATRHAEQPFSDLEKARLRKLYVLTKAQKEHLDAIFRGEA